MAAWSPTKNPPSPPAWVYSHGGPIGRRKRRNIPTTDQSNGALPEGALRASLTMPPVARASPAPACPPPSHSAVPDSTTVTCVDGIGVNVD
eukprot:873938-Pyramimonas_sp.AAC.1